MLCLLDPYWNEWYPIMYREYSSDDSFNNYISVQENIWLMDGRLIGPDNEQTVIEQLKITKRF